MEAFIPRGQKLGEGFSKSEKLAAQAIHPQHSASKGQSRIGWLDSLLSLKKVVILCSWCRSKFNPRKANYRRVYVPDYTGKTDGYTVNGDCDYCGAFTAVAGGGTAYQPEELYFLTHQDPTEARRRSRANAGWKTTYSAITS
jgi:hypothetical protein